MPVITNVEDLRLLAKKRVPKMFYDYADSGSWTESTYRGNEADFQGIKFRQRELKWAARAAGFRPLQSFYDDRRWFSVNLMVA